MGLVFDLRTPLEQAGLSRRDYQFLKSRHKTTIADVLKKIPKQWIMFDPNADPYLYLYGSYGFVIQVKTMDVPENRPFLFLYGEDRRGIKYRVVSYEKTRWYNILSKLLAKYPKITLMVYGQVLPSAPSTKGVNVDLTIFASFVDFYAQARNRKVLYYSDWTINERYAKIVAGLLPLTRLEDVLWGYYPFKPLPIGEAWQVLHTFQPDHLLSSARERYLTDLLTYRYLQIEMGYRRLLAGNGVVPHIAADSCYDNPPLPFGLDDLQKSAIDEAVNMCKSPQPEVLYVVGDVGSGKSIVAYATIYTLLKSKVKEGGALRAVLLAPTRILAEQHYRNLIFYYPELSDQIELRLGGAKPSEKLRPILIGTHALLQQAGQSCDLVVIDEPQKFGVQHLLSWSGKTHYLFLTATPLPRWTFLLVSQKIHSVMLTGRQRRVEFVPLPYTQSMLKKILQTLPPDRKTLIVVPRLDADGNYPNLKEMSALLSEMSIPHALLHGQMKQEEMLNNIEAFRSGAVFHLVSTSIIEAGIDIPDIRYLLVLGPEMFGLSNLYQISGRVGRDGERSFVYMVSLVSENIKQNIEYYTSGFETALIDLKLRGQGDFGGNEQHGDLPLPLAEFITPEIIENAKQICQRVIESQKLQEIVDSLSLLYD